MTTETATNPVEGADTSFEEFENTVANEAEVEAAENLEIEADDDEANPETEAEDDSEEIELDGIKAKVPKPLKEAFLRQADYTRKTQELAEQRKALEAERNGYQQATREEMQAQARLIATDEQLQAYSKVDWNAWNEQDPFEAQKAFMQFQQLKDSRTQVAGYLGQIQQQRTFQAQQETAKRLEEGRAVLAKEIPGWGDQKAAELLAAGVAEYKFERDEIAEFSDPRMVIALNDAVQWRNHLKKQKQLQNIAQGQKTAPAKTLKGTAARGPVRADTDDFAAFERMADNKLKG